MEKISSAAAADLNTPIVLSKFARAQKYVSIVGTSGG